MRRTFMPDCAKGKGEGMKGRGAIYWSSIFGLVLFLGTAEAGWVIQVESRGGMETTQETTWLQKEKIRSEGGDHAHIMDFTERRVLWIDSKQRKYSSMTFEEFKQFIRESMRQASAAMEEMKKMGIQVPGQPAGPRGKVTVRKGPGATVAGYACDGYSVSVGGKLSEEIWVTRRIDLASELGSKAKKEFEDLERDLKKMGTAFKPEVEDPEYAKIFEGGYPMRIQDKESGFVREVTKAEKKDVSADVFREPKGYAKVPITDLYGISREDTGGQRPSSAAPRATDPGGRGADYRRRQAEEAAEAARQDAYRQSEEQRSEGADAAKEGVGEGIRKIFKW